MISQRCSKALHILDRFHIVANMNKALDEVRAAESRKMAQEGYEPLLKKSRWCVLKRKENRHCSPAGPSARSAPLQPADGAGLPPERGLSAVLDLQLAQMGRHVPGFLVRPNDAVSHRADEEDRPTLRAHRALLINYLKAKKQFSSGGIQG